MPLPRADVLNLCGFVYSKTVQNQKDMCPPAFRYALDCGWKTVPTSTHGMLKRYCMASMGFFAFTICKKF
jgi:hypothetical protein